MELHLKLIKAENTTIGDIRKIIYGIEKVGFNVEALPTEINPAIIKVSKPTEKGD